ncbi:MAG: MFS transporter [Candidatus Acidiferrales bacterium]
MSVFSHFRRLNALQRRTFLACFLGWSLDAFDFFTFAFCMVPIAVQFHVKVSEVAEGIFLTLAMRPVGAFLFGMLAERIGRRPTLMINVISFSIFELASAFAPTLRALLILRACFGVAMGGEWGVGAALTFETLPAEGRGFFSAVLQEGYMFGNLLAGLVFGALFPHFGWRAMFLVGALPAFLVLFIRAGVEESPAWKSGRAVTKEKRAAASSIFSHLGILAFLAVLMFAFNSFSHGTQDLYPTFLLKNRDFTPHMVGAITIIYNCGAILGAICFGAWSERIGRRRAIVVAALLSIPLIPLWVYAHTFVTLAIGSFLMQFMNQGAWGIIPAHLNELSPPSLRATFPGVAYQLGNLLASRNAVIQAKLAEQRYGGNYAPVFAWTVVVIALLVAAITLMGDEAKGRDLSSTS